MYDTLWRCPICNRKPKVKKFGRYNAVVSCSGRFMKYHDTLTAVVEVSNMNDLDRVIKEEWNRVVLDNDCANLPVI